MKNSSRFEVKMARNFALSSSGVRSSSAWARTRSLKSSQLRSRSIHTACRPVGKDAFSAPWSPMDAKTVVAIEIFPRLTFRFYGPTLQGSVNGRLHLRRYSLRGTNTTATVSGSILAHVIAFHD